MKKYFSLDNIDFEFVNGSAITIGMFDGVHLGHQQVIQTCCDFALKENLNSVLITFSNHPSEFFNPNSQPKLLNTLEERLSLLELTKLDYVIILPFDIETAALSAHNFVQDILIKLLKCRILIFGYDNHFGKNREGSPIFIQRNYADSIKTVVVNEQMLDQEVISSTRLKRYIENGEVDLANKCMGYDFSISSEVVHGNALGRTIGFPTANMNLSGNLKVLPESGVYLTKSTVIINDIIISRHGITNVGYRPTIQNTPTLSIETNLFDFDSDIYGYEITTNFIKKIRSEIKFESLSELRNQIHKDKIEAIKLLTKIHITSQKS